MRYVQVVILLITLMLSVNPAFAKETRYRVELLVLTHLENQADPREFLQLEDYSPAIDFLTPLPEVALEEDGLEVIEPETPLVEGELTGELTGEEADTELAEELPPAIHIEEKSSVMQEAWRRLRLSGPFRPEQYLSWEQGDEEPFPALRIHDLEVIMVEDPYAELRLEMAEQAELTETTEQAETEPESEEGEPAIPEPTVYYRLDGSATLTRTRFLHMDLNLQLREAVWNEDPLAVTGTEPPLFIDDPTDELTENMPPLPSAFLVHELKQTRLVKTGRMEYFDGAVLGVLAFITSIEVEDEESPDEQ